MGRPPCESCAARCKDWMCDAYRRWIGDQWELFQGRFLGDYRGRLSGDKFYYAHPDEVRRYLQEGVCGGCRAEGICDTPCPAYWRWWDARMEVAKMLAEHRE